MDSAMPANCTDKSFHHIIVCLRCKSIRTEPNKLPWPVPEKIRLRCKSIRTVSHALVAGCRCLKSYSFSSHVFPGFSSRQTSGNRFEYWPQTSPNVVFSFRHVSGNRLRKPHGEPFVPRWSQSSFNTRVWTWPLLATCETQISLSSLSM